MKKKNLLPKLFLIFLTNCTSLKGDNIPFCVLSSVNKTFYCHKKNNWLPDTKYEVKVVNNWVCFKKSDVFNVCNIDSKKVYLIDKDMEVFGGATLEELDNALCFSPKNLNRLLGSCNW